MDTMLPKITDYWSAQDNAIERISEAVLELSPADRAAALEKIEASVTRHVRVLDDETLLMAAVAAAESLYRTASWIGEWNEGILDYLSASSATFWGLFCNRGFTLQYLVDNAFHDFRRPLDLFPLWYQAAGLVYLSPQFIARALMRNDAGADAPFEQLLPSYNREARDVAVEAISRCHDERRSFLLLDTDFEEETFQPALGLRRRPGILTVFRNQAPEPGTTVSTWFPT